MSPSAFLKVWVPLGAVLPAGFLPPAGGSPPLLLLPWLGGRKVCLILEYKLTDQSVKLIYKEVCFFIEIQFCFILWAMALL
jgi:hypothetical protein